ncbi:hypothetical protein DL96DRAFT_1305437 [Flagelloscypha sp. PMI_526]|nr:hypothetical protein DL96DRAFT_1305437 [Flagelloscypha sp. PMI_526]
MASPVESFTPFLIALTLAVPLWSLSVAQTSGYFRHYWNDKIILKLIVSTCFFLMTVQLATFVYMMYFYLVTCRAPENYAFLSSVIPGLLPVSKYMTYTVTTVVQLFYAMRVWIVSNKNRYITGTIAAMSMTQFVAGFAVTSYLVKKGDLSAVYSHFERVVGSLELVSNMLCDIVISGALVWFLQRNKQTSLVRTRYVINKLMLYSINTGLLANVVVFLNLVTWLTVPQGNFIFAIFLVIFMSIRCFSPAFYFQDGLQ